jgi:hypothetical protein
MSPSEEGVTIHATIPTIRLTVQNVGRKVVMSAVPHEIPASEVLAAVQEDPELARVVMRNRQAKRILGAALSTLPTRVSPATAQRVQATENAWRDIEEEFGMLSSGEVAELVGKKGRSYAHDRRAAGQLLGVKRGGHYRYPAFEFDDSGPRPVVQKVAREAKELGVREASVLLWMVTPSTWWDGIGPDRANRPVDYLDSPDEVLAAFRSAFGSEW